MITLEIKKTSTIVRVDDDARRVKHEKERKKNDSFWKADLNFMKKKVN